MICQFPLSYVIMQNPATAVRSKHETQYVLDAQSDPVLVGNRALQLLLTLLALAAISLLLHVLLGATVEDPSHKSAIGRPRFIDAEQRKIIFDNTWDMPRMKEINDHVNAILKVEGYEDIDLALDQLKDFVIWIYEDVKDTAQKEITTLIHECIVHGENTEFDCSKRTYMYMLYKTNIPIKDILADLTDFFEN